MKQRVFIMVSIPLLCILGASAAMPTEDAPATRVNPGWYGWLGDFHNVKGYYPPHCDRAYFDRHNIAWFWLGHQWVVPYLESGTCKVREAIAENKGRAKIWYEAYWWGDHSRWGDGAHRDGFARAHIPPWVLTKLQESGIQPGGDDIRGKDWLALAHDEAAMASVKKTIQWQIDTILRHCGKDALYGVVLSEEEPDHGANVVLGQKGGAMYGKRREEVRKKLVRVHNALYDFVKTRYPQLKVSPGFYPHWVKPGTLKMDAVVMDLYPPPGKEEEKIERWIEAYGLDTEQYVLLWGYGDRDRHLECDRFDRMVAGLLGRDIRNLGVFRAELALQDRVHRLFDVHGTRGHEPDDMARHRRNVEQLWTETRRVTAELMEREENTASELPSVPEQAWESRNGLVQWTNAIYAFRQRVLDRAYEDLQRVGALTAIPRLADLLAAEGMVTAGIAYGPAPDSTQLGKWERLSKEFDSVPRFYESVAASLARSAINAKQLAAQIAGAVQRPPSGLVGAPLHRFVSDTKRLTELIRAQDFKAATTHFHGVHDILRGAGSERSFRLRVVFSNGYKIPLNVRVTLTASRPDGSSRELYAEYPCQTADAQREIVLLLPRRPASLTFRTSSWTGTLRVSSLELSHSSVGVLQPTAVIDVDHTTGATEWVEREGRGAAFALSPYASTASATVVY
ncbi:MAG: hypothetical protein HN742_20545 [Lentisphaerae bacterium]|jgi:hypothetical protein|nr:hypothetical protein [Lentisphaerota bacterium]MBT5611521.1 hypothetical protein [Lentisphaerota bacterium]MBT7054757.1 hypothetical protein [Lentisphaerota bacterium]MBT7844281.1 hypothetical protein [Lentisphaerota bacterium]